MAHENHTHKHLIQATVYIKTTIRILSEYEINSFFPIMKLNYKIESSYQHTMIIDHITFLLYAKKKNENQNLFQLI